MQHRHFKSALGASIFASSNEARRRKFRRTSRVNEMNLIRNYRNWRRYRDTVTELNRLSNRELSDLGIARGDIPFVARKSV